MKKEEKTRNRMFQTTFDIPIFDIVVTLIQVESPEDHDAVMDVIHSYNMGDEIENEVSQNIRTDSFNGGVTFWNGGIHTAIVVFYRMDDDKRKSVCYGHEKRHVEDHVLKSCEIYDKETAGYLAGWLTPIFDMFKDGKASDVAPIRRVNDKKIRKRTVKDIVNEITD